ncbi:MAG: PspA/IM30 family protein [Lachnospiraceae bacterium]|nr:PspA/IM30 family protein [Lachnospiraceae bacterium]
MGILKRFKEIMAANINALLDKAEDPAKMIDQYLRDMEEDLGEVKAETASIMADEAKAKRKVDELQKEVDTLQNYAERAVAAGNEADAREFLAQKAKVQVRLDDAKKIYDVNAENAKKMREMHDKLVSDIAELNARKDLIKAKVAVAKAQEKVNDATSAVTGVTDTMNSFAKMEEKADHMLDEANAMAELNMTSAQQSIEDLKDKYDNDLNRPDIDEEIKAIKEKLGKE